MGGFITLFGGLNSAKAQEPNSINNDSIKVENKNYLSDHEKVSRNFYKLEDIMYASDYGPEGDGLDYWQTPKETFLRGKGDCEDKSIYFQDELEKEGIETKAVFGKYSGKSKFYHLWLEGVLDGENCIIECSGKGLIYNRDSINNLDNEFLYRSSREHLKYVTDKINDYYNRTEKVLEIKDFEYLQKTIPLLTSPEFSFYSSDSTFLKTLPKKK